MLVTTYYYRQHKNWNAPPDSPEYPIHWDCIERTPQSIDFGKFSELEGPLGGIDISASILAINCSQRREINRFDGMAIWRMLWKSHYLLCPRCAYRPLKQS